MDRSRRLESRRVRRWQIRGSTSTRKNHSTPLLPPNGMDAEPEQPAEPVFDANTPTPLTPEQIARAEAELGIYVPNPLAEAPAVQQYLLQPCPRIGAVVDRYHTAAQEHCLEFVRFLDAIHARQRTAISVIQQYVL